MAKYATLEDKLFTCNDRLFNDVDQRVEEHMIENVEVKFKFRKILLERWCCLFHVLAASSVKK